MKLIFKIGALVAFWMAAVALVLPQTCAPGGGVTCTPNLNLWLPPANYPNWNVPTNANWSTVDQFLGGSSPLPNGLIVGGQPLVVNSSPKLVPYEGVDGSIQNNLYTPSTSSPATTFAGDSLLQSTIVTALFAQPKTSSTNTTYKMVTYGLYATPRIESSGATTPESLYGGQLYAVRGGAADASGLGDHVTGIGVTVGHAANLPTSAATTTVRGMQANTAFQSGAVSSMAGFYTQPLVGAATGPAGLVLANNYGIYIDTPQLANGATITNDYGVYVADATAKNVFAGSVQSPQFCIGASCITAWPGGGGVADVNITVPSFAVPSNQCYGSSGSTTPATFPMTGLSVGMKVSAGDTGNPSAITGWGASGGLTIRSWASAPNQGSYIVCNTSAGAITGGAISFVMGAQ